MTVTCVLFMTKLSKLKYDLLSQPPTKSNLKCNILLQLDLDHFELPLNFTQGLKSLLFMISFLIY